MFTYTVSDGKITITACDTAISGDVVIPSTIDGYPVTKIGEKAFFACRNIKGITIPDGVTEIGEMVFGECLFLAKIVIPESVMNIGEYAFYNCVSLTEITLPSGITEIGRYAFAWCSLLKSINIPYGVTSIGERAFYVCSNLKKVDYYGTEADKENITIGVENDSLTDASWNCKISSGDSNRDGSIDAIDLVNLSIVLLSDNTDYRANTANDANGDEVVNLLDYIRLKRFLAEVN